MSGRNRLLLNSSYSIITGLVYQQALLYLSNSPQVAWQFLSTKVVNDAAGLAAFSTVWSLVIYAVFAMLGALLLVRLEPSRPILYTLLFTFPVIFERSFGYFFWRHLETFNYWPNLVLSVGAIILPAALFLALRTRDIAPQ